MEPTPKQELKMVVLTMNNDLNQPNEYPDQTGKYWELFNHLANEHGITLLDEEMDQIKIICDRLNQPDESKSLKN